MKNFLINFLTYSLILVFGPIGPKRCIHWLIGFAVFPSTTLIRKLLSWHLFTTSQGNLPWMIMVPRGCVATFKHCHRVNILAAPNTCVNSYFKPMTYRGQVLFWFGNRCSLSLYMARSPSFIQSTISQIYSDNKQKRSCPVNSDPV